MECSLFRVRVPWPEPGGYGAVCRGAGVRRHARALADCLRARTQVHVRFVTVDDSMLRVCVCVCACVCVWALLQGLHHGAGVHPRGRGGPAPLSLCAGRRGNRS